MFGTASIKGLLIVVVTGATAFTSGCSEGGASGRSGYSNPPIITGVDELETIGDFRAKLETLPSAYKKASFLLVRAKVEKSLQMVLEANLQPTASPKERTDAIKLAAVQAAVLKTIAESAHWPAMAEVYSESSEVFQAMVRGELEKDQLLEVSTRLTTRTEVLIKEFLDREADSVNDTHGIDAFSDRFGAAIIANTKAYAWGIDTSKLQ